METKYVIKFINALHIFLIGLGSLCILHQYDIVKAIGSWLALSSLLALYRKRIEFPAIMMFTIAVIFTVKVIMQAM